MVDATRLNAVFDWKMSKDEAHAYYLAVIWEQETRKMFPNKQLAKLPPKSDPRKCTLFRYCWKLIRETRGLLTPEEYQQYIHGNLRIIQHHNGRIEPNCLCGDKAWIRWKVFKRLLEKRLAQQRQEEIPVVNINSKIANELDCTKKFLYEKMEGEPSLDKFSSISSKIMVWVETGRISKYYLVMSPWIQKLNMLETLEQQCSFTRSIYIIDENIRQFFKQEFSHEFNNI